MSMRNAFILLAAVAGVLFVFAAPAFARDDLLSSDGTSADPSLSSSGRATDNSLSSDAKPTDKSLSSDAKPTDRLLSAPKPDLCSLLTKHTPDADVAYQPGVDARGKPVIPADDGGSPAPNLPSAIKIPLTVNLAKVLNLNTAQYPYNQLGTGTEAGLGMIEVNGDRVTLNGKPLTNDQQANLSVLCIKSH